MTKDEWAALPKEKGMILYASSGGHFLRFTLETAFDDDFKHAAVLRLAKEDEAMPDRRYFPCEQIITPEELERRQRAEREPPLPTKTCPVCGKTFHPQGPQQKLCSDACRKKRMAQAGHERAKAMPPVRGRPARKCIMCGAMFIPKSWNQKTCSPECSALRHRQTSEEFNRKHQGKERKLLDKVCPVCQTHFKTYRENRVTCSSACREAWEKKYHKGYYRRHKEAAE